MKLVRLALSKDEIEAIGRWQNQNVIGSRAAAIRELVRQELLRDGFGQLIPNAPTDAGGAQDEENGESERVLH